jgi:hypothetical protein
LYSIEGCLCGPEPSWEPSQIKLLQKSAQAVNGSLSFYCAERVKQFKAIIKTRKANLVKIHASITTEIYVKHGHNLIKIKA